MNTQTILDKTAIGLSLACIVHCLFFPLIVVLLPSIAALPLDEEQFHIWMVVAVIPTSAYALFMGCRRHKRYRLILVGCLGLALLAAAAFLGHDILNHDWEEILTVAGAATIALGHFWNYRLCRRHDDNCVNPDPS